MSTASDAWNFAELEEFWALYQPLTPFGKDGRDERRVFFDRAMIETSLDFTQKALVFLEGMKADPVSMDRIDYHLKRMPRLTLAHQDEYDLVEIFQVKKFCANFRAVLNLVGEHAREEFSLSFTVEDLARELDSGGSDAESFYIADSFHPELQPLRLKISRLDILTREERDALSNDIEEKFGIAFGGREFVLVPHAAARQFIENKGPWVLEPYDESSWLLRLSPSPDLLALMADRDKLAVRERELEAIVLRALSSRIRASLPELRACVDTLCRFDMALARARMALMLSLSRPCMNSPDLIVEDGRFIPCQKSCERLGLRYTALTARFDRPVTLLFGSNMGGKTVVLKTVLFLQIIAQAGLYVPAKKYSTRVFSGLVYVGELSGEPLEGLSGFGFEICRFLEAWRMADSGPLIVFDEFARTTGSHEAEALLSAVVEGLAEKKTSCSFFATHFRGVARIAGADYRKMRGLDSLALRERMNADTPLSARLASVNRHMRYEVVDDDGSGKGSDAIDVATMLGLEPRLASRAMSYILGGSPDGDSFADAKD